MSSRGAMRYRATIERAALTADAGGSPARSWEPLATGVPCWAWLKSSQGATLKAEGGKTVVVDARHITVPIGTDVRVGDRVTVLNRRQTRVVFAAMLIDGMAERPDHLLLMARALS